MCRPGARRPSARTLRETWHLDAGRSPGRPPPFNLPKSSFYQTNIASPSVFVTLILLLDPALPPPSAGLAMFTIRRDWFARLCALVVLLFGLGASWAAEPSALVQLVNRLIDEDRSRGIDSALGLG